MNAAVPKAPKDLGQIPADALPDLSEEVEEQSIDTAQVTPEAQEAIQIDFDKDVGEAELTQDQLAQAQTIEGDEFDERATTQYQLGQLLNSIEEGKPMPPGLHLQYEKWPVLCKLVAWVRRLWPLLR